MPPQPCKALTSRETRHLDIGRGLMRTHAAPAAAGRLSVGALPFDEAVRMVTASDIRDSVRAIAILRAARLHPRAN